MKKTIALLTALLLAVGLAACGTQGNTPADKKQSSGEANGGVQSADSALTADASAAYAAFLARYGTFSTLYASDVNADGCPEVVAVNDYTEENDAPAGQFMLTYTQKGGLSVIYPRAHSSMGVKFRVSEDNCLYFTDDGHNVGTAAYHSGFVYSVDETGFVQMGRALGEPWPEDLDINDPEVFEKTDAEYDRIFADKIRAITGDKTFTDCAQNTPDDTDAFLNEALDIDLAAAREAYAQAKTDLGRAIADAAGAEPASLFVSDYDRDGTYEAFAFVEEDALTGSEIWTGSIWFANAQGTAKKIQTGAVTSEDLGVLSCTYHDYFQAPLLGGSSAPTCVWEVRGGDCKEMELFYISATGLEIVKLPYSEILPPETIVSTLSTFDMSFSDDMTLAERADGMGSGHTHKPYFFRDTPEGVKEYGGIQVQRSEVAALSGGKELLKLAEKNGRKIESIYYRENGILNISMSKKDGDGTEYTNFSACLADGQLQLLSYELDASYTDNPENDLMGGFYVAAISPNDATYPAKMP